MTGHIRVIAIYQSSRNIKKNAVIMRTTTKSAKLTNKPMPDLFTVILTKTIQKQSNSLIRVFRKLLQVIVIKG